MKTSILSVGVAFLATYTAIASDPNSRLASLPGSDLLGAGSFGITTKVTPHPIGETRPPFHAAVFKHYYCDGMYRVEISYLDDGGHTVKEWIHAYNKEFTYYYHSDQRLLAVNGGGASRDWMVDTATRQSFYAFQFLVPAVMSPVNQSDGTVSSDYKAFVISDIWDASRWANVAGKMSTLAEENGSKVLSFGGEGYTTGSYSLRYRFDDHHPSYPSEIEKLASSGTGNERYVVKQWMEVPFKSASGVTTQLQLPKEALLTSEEGGIVYTFTVETLAAEANTERLRGKEFYSLDFSMADRVLDESTGKVIVIPK